MGITRKTAPMELRCLEDVRTEARDTGDAVGEVELEHQVSNLRRCSSESSPRIIVIVSRGESSFMFSMGMSSPRCRIPGELPTCDVKVGSLPARASGAANRRSMCGTSPPAPAGIPTDVQIRHAHVVGASHRGRKHDSLGRGWARPTGSAVRRPRAGCDDARVAR